MALEAQAVETLFHECMGFDVEIEGIVEKARFRQDKLDESAELIKEMLLELPDEFRKSGGGGWSFLNACNDRHGNQWTGLHRTMDRLFMLGAAIDYVEPVMPRSFWPVFPGGMPYYVIKDV